MGAELGFYFQMSSEVAQEGLNQGRSGLMRVSRHVRLLAVLTLVMASLAAPSVASAGTLTSATFTTAGTGYAVTSAKNTRYDWAFTTATSGTTSRVSATVPPGTGAYGQQYLTIAKNNAGNYVTTPDSVATSPTSALDVRAKVSTAELASGTGYQELVTKWVDFGTGSSFLFRDLNGQLQIIWSPDGNTGTARVLQTSAINWNGATTGWVRATIDATSGTNTVVTLWNSLDGAAWSSLNTSTITGSYPVADTTTGTTVGGRSDQVETFTGKTYLATVSKTINGTTTSPSGCNATGVTACFNPTDYVTGTTISSSSAQAETWTINRNTSNLPADIATDLNVVATSGVPSNGAASYRAIDGLAVYLFPNNPVISAGTPCTLSLSGFVNTAIAGSYTSNIATYDNTATSNVIDSVTTAALTFTAAANSTTASATIDPTFTFSVNSYTGQCASVITPTAGTTSTATAVGLGHLAASGTAVANQGFYMATNAGNGAVVYIRSLGSLSDGSGHSIVSVPGTNASPASFPSTGTAAFGYQSDGSASLAGGWAALTSTNQALKTLSSASAFQSWCIAYQAQTAPTTPAGSYSTTVIYTAVPTF